MRVTYAEFLRLPPHLQAKVTHLDMTDDPYLPRPRGDAEEWPGEAGPELDANGYTVRR